MTPLQLLKLEWKKFSPNGTFRLLSGFYLGFFVLLVYVAYLIGRNFTYSNGGETFNPFHDLYEFPHSWELIASLGSWFNALILGMMGVTLITMEIGYKTLRQNIITGLTRRELFLAKVYFALAIALVATFSYLLIGAVAGFTAGHLTSFWDIFPSISGVLLFFFQAFSYLIVGMLLGFILKQTAFALILLIFYVIILENLLYGILYFAVTKSQLIHYLPNASLRGIVPWPMPQALGDLKSQPLLQGPSLTHYTLAAILYVALFLYLLHLRLRKSDL